MLPNFMIIGAQKSATTWLHYCLAEHPQVWVRSGGKSHFADPDYANFSLAQIEEYCREGRCHEAVGLKKPNYFVNKDVPERTAKHLPDVKLIVLLRDPVVRAVSTYFHLMRYGFIPIREVNEGMGAVLKGRYDNTYGRARQVIAGGKYGEALERWKRYFPGEQIKVIIQEELGVELRDIFTFLEVNDAFVPQAAYSHRRGGIYSLPRLRWINMRNRWLYRYDRDRTMLKRQTNLKVRLIGPPFMAVDRVMASVLTNTRPQLDEGIKSELVRLYESDVRKLESALGRDIHAWQDFQQLTV